MNFKEKKQNNIPQYIISQCFPTYMHIKKKGKNHKEIFVIFFHVAVSKVNICNYGLGCTIRINKKKGYLYCENHADVVLRKQGSILCMETLGKDRRDKNRFHGLLLWSYLK